MSVKKTMNHIEYPKQLKAKSVPELMFIQKDAAGARDAMPDGENAGYYADEVSYVSMELKRRQN